MCVCVCWIHQNKVISLLSFFMIAFILTSELIKATSLWNHLTLPR